MQFEIILSFIGLMLSAYAYRTTLHLKRAPNQKLWCDISNRMSCTRAFLAKESHLFVLPNSGWGLLYYFVIILCLEVGWTQWALYLSAVGLGISLYLSYILYYKQKNFCVVCWTVHLLNLFLFASLLFSNFLH